MHRFFGYIPAVVMMWTIAWGGAAVAISEPQPQSALSVSPAITELIVTPGKPVRKVLRVTNITRHPLPIKVTVKNFTPIGEEVSPKDKQILDASSWFEIQEPDFILQPGQTRNVTAVVRPPEGAEPGGHYATVFFQPLVPVEALTSSTAYLSAKVGVLTLLIVKGDIVEQATLGDLRLESQSPPGTVELSMPLSNEGNVHLLPTGQVRIYNWRNREVANLPLTPNIVLPGSTKRLTFTWDTSWRIGRYRAVAEISYGTDQQRLQSQPLLFWVIPWAYVLGLLGVAGVAGGIGFKFRGRWKPAWAALRGATLSPAASPRAHSRQNKH